jgi:predicted nucleotidyltransferase
VNSVFDTDFTEFIEILNDVGVKYVLVGGYSVILHGYQRVTGDLDLYIEPSEENYKLLMKAFIKFGLPTDAIELSEFLNPKEVDVFTFGRPPVAIDLMTKLADFSFDEVYKEAFWFEMENLKVKLIHLNHLKISKSFAGRYKDLDDLSHLP